jgi:protein-L-isoaspartate(D-aspartate) O-methyltransferase
MNLPDETPPHRLEMLRDQLAARGIRDRRVLEAMSRLPRERFVDPEQSVYAYADRALPIACDQTISQPYIVALMTQALELSGRERVLEIGTGSGYQTALLAELAGEVISIERHALLSQQASETLSTLGYRNVSLIVGDGTLGWPPAAPYDRIIVTAAADSCPPAVLEQLDNQGLLVIPLGPPKSQMLARIQRDAGHFHRTNLTACRFVPLVGSSTASWARDVE